ncbi:MAG: sulfite exporter TauE/SafE family protein [Methylophilus sp.]|nr:sulfite exporter TauE/SafE family protein [Methylophilus sp.]
MVSTLWCLWLRKMPDIQLISIVLGLLIGLTLALTGAGGGVLAIPLLVFGLHLNITQAAPIALLSIFFASGIGALQGLSKGIVRYKAAMLIAAFGVIFAPLGVKLSSYLPQTILSITLACILLLIANRTWKLSNRIDESNTELPPPVCTINPATSKLFWTADCTKRLIATGSITGLLSGLLGVGGGFIIVPSLKKVSNFNHATVVATTLAVIALISTSSLASYMHHTNIHWKIAVPFVISTTLAMLLLGLLRHKIPEGFSQKAFALLCLIAAIYLTAKSFYF